MEDGMRSDHLTWRHTCVVLDFEQGFVRSSSSPSPPPSPSPSLSFLFLPHLTFTKVELLCGKTVGSTLRKRGLPICQTLIRGTRKKLTLYQLGMIDINMRMIKTNMTKIIISWFSNESCERWHWCVRRCVHKTGVTPMMSIHGKVLNQIKSASAGCSFSKNALYKNGKVLNQTLSPSVGCSFSKSTLLS